MFSVRLCSSDQMSNFIHFLTDWPDSLLYEAQSFNYAFALYLRSFDVCSCILLELLDQLQLLLHLGHPCLAITFLSFQGPHCGLLCLKICLLLS